MANQGYSHLSGMDRMSLMYMCFHSCNRQHTSPYAYVTTDLVPVPFTLRGWWRLSWISLDPLFLDVLVVLLGPTSSGLTQNNNEEDVPEHTTQSLSHDVLKIITDTVPGDAAIEFVGIDSSFLDIIIKELFIQDSRIFIGGSSSHLEPDDDTSSFSRNAVKDVVCSGLGSGLVGVDELSGARLGSGLRGRFDGMGGSTVGLTIVLLDTVTIGGGFLFGESVLG